MPRLWPLLALSVLPCSLHGQQRWALREDLRLGSLDDGPASFADIRGIATNSKGWIFVLDFSTQDIRVFDADGRHLKTVGRAGSGPGEFRNANGLARAPDGTIWANDPANSRFTVLDAEGNFLRHHAVTVNGYGYLWFGFFDPSGRLVEPLFVRAADPKDRRGALRAFTAGLAGVDTLWTLDCGEGWTPPPPWRFKHGDGYAMVGVPFSAGPVSVLDVPDAQWCGWNSEYRLHRRSLSRGDTLATVRGRADALPVTRRERDSIVADLERRFPGARVDGSAIPERKPVIRHAFVDPLGRLWVRLARRDPGTRFDIYDRSGKAVAVLETGLDPTIYHTPILDGDRMYVVVAGEDDVPQVVRARLERR